LQRAGQGRLAPECRAFQALDQRGRLVALADQQDAGVLDGKLLDPGAVGQAPRVVARLEEARAALAGVPGFMAEPSVELATAALVQRLETAVAEASPGNRSCAIRNRSPLADSRTGRFPRAVVQVRLLCGNAELAAVLHSLEQGAPRLFVDNLNVLVQRQFFAAGSQGAGLDVSFDLYGYLRPPATPAGTASGGPDAR
jgi:general secretion pathway protein M